MQGRSSNGAFAPRSIFNTATIDLAPEAVGALERFGWLEAGQPACQMAVNEACTRLVQAALSKGLALIEPVPQRSGIRDAASGCQSGGRDVGK